jgi:hypothetical protein
MVTTAKDAEHILRDVKGKGVFQLHMGATINSLKDLAEALDIMSDKSFGHHVTATKNDFGSWIRDVLGDTELADAVYKCKSKQSILKKVDERIEELEYRLSQSHITTKEIMGLGAVDFIVGLIVGFLGGLVLASLL